MQILLRKVQVCFRDFRLSFSPWWLSQACANIWTPKAPAVYHPAYSIAMLLSKSDHSGLVMSNSAQPVGRSRYYMIYSSYDGL
jgi:hypothetical protein